MKGGSSKGHTCPPVLIRGIYLCLACLALLRLGMHFCFSDSTVHPGVQLACREEVMLKGTLDSSPHALDSRLYLLTVSLDELQRKSGLRVSASGEVICFVPAENLPAYASSGTETAVTARYDSQTGELRSTGEAVCIPPEGGGVGKKAAEARFSARRWVQERFSSLYWEAQQLACSLILGRPVSRSDSLFENCRLSGTAHVMALSGLHVGILLQLLNLLLLPAAGRRRSRIITMVLLGGYVWFAGIRESLVRSVGMYWFYSASDLLGRPLSGGKLLGITALSHIILFPEGAVTMSFLLSYGSVAGIILLFRMIYDSFPWYIPPALRAAASLSISASCGSWPVLKAFGMEVYPAGVLLSIPAIAGVTVFMWLAILYLCFPWFPLLEGLLRITAVGLTLLWKTGAQASSLPVFSFPLWAGSIGALLTLLLALQYRGFRRAYGNSVACVSSSALQFPVDDQGSDEAAGAETDKTVRTEFPD